MIYSFKDVRLMASSGFTGNTIRDKNQSLKIELSRQILGINKWKLATGFGTTLVDSMVPVSAILNS